MAEERARVLLVEDNAADARLMREVLSEVPRPRFAVTGAGTLAEAVTVVAGHDVVLLDLSLPDAFGSSTISRMVEAAKDVPVIVLTGNTDSEVSNQAVSLGADDYLLKSEITPSLLARTIQYTIERRRGIEKSRRMLALEIARAESQRAAERARFLSDVSAAFATTLDLDQVVASVCRAVVPVLADHCNVHLVGGGNHDGAVAGAIRERRTIELPEAATFDDRARQDGSGTALVLPLVAHDRSVGALVLVSRRHDWFDDDRRVLAEEVARRTAVAIDNALLHAAVQRALDARDEMLAVVSHDLRNPLSLLSLTLRLIRGSVEKGTLPALDLIARGSRAIGRMERLINDLLDVARIDAGTLAVAKAPIDLGAVARDAVEQNGALAAEKKIRIDTQIEGEAITEGDRDRLMQVITNLLGNAIKFTPEGGRIAVSCARRSSAVEVRVADSGPGIPPESLPHVFDRFYQSSGRAKARAEGVGLGLTIAKGIVDAHGGRIGVESQPGSGADFWFELPVPAMEAVA
jgi:signal transduction histidine kinase/DNA-binding NarL/FixJ family response regulator